MSNKKQFGKPQKALKPNDIKAINDEVKRGVSWGGPWMDEIEKKHFNEKEIEWVRRTFECPDYFFKILNHIKVKNNYKNIREALVYMMIDYSEKTFSESELEWLHLKDFVKKK